MKQIILLMAAMAGVLLAAPALAQHRNVAAEAQAAGLVGERYDGYLGIVTSVSPDIRRQVAAINIRRRALYSSLAARRNATPAEVGITAACALLGRVGVGQYYLLGTGVWQRRQPGQSALRPEYCV